MDLPVTLPSDYQPFERTELTGSIVSRFEKIARRYPDSLAVKASDAQFTYQELDSRTDQIADAILAQLGIGAEAVAFLFTHSAQYIVAQISVLKAGKFYCSLDSELPIARLHELLDSLGSRIIVCNSACAELASELSRERTDCTCLDVETLASDFPIQRQSVTIDGSSIAYIVFTGGSTGPPQGVVVAHRNVLHFSMSHTNNMHLNHRDRASQICPLTAGASAGEIYPIILNGGTVLPFSIKRNSMRTFARWLKRERVSVYTSVPVVFRLLTRALSEDDTLPDVRLVRLAGDRILGSDVERFKRHFSETALMRVALSGTEVLMITQFYVDMNYDSDLPVVPVGYPLDDMEVSIVDDELNPLPVGSEGEIAVTSEFLSVGYWKNPRLTSERFLTDPNGSVKRTYLTRDMGYFLPDGCLIHLGRKDFRVKVYGKMVSITDAEKALLSLPEVSEAVVVASDHDDYGTRLTGFFVASGNSKPTPASLREALLKNLPPELVPARLIELSVIPVTASNKVDRKKLVASAAGDQE